MAEQVGNKDVALPCPVLSSFAPTLKVESFGLLLPPALHHTQDPTCKYEVRHQIGRGSFGSAFLVTNKQDKAEYVLKRVRLAKQTNWQRNSTLQERKLVRR